MTAAGLKNGMFGRGQLGIGEWYQDPVRPTFTTGTFTSSTPLVNGAGQTGSSLVTDGWASGASSLKKGSRRRGGRRAGKSESPR